MNLLNQCQLWTDREEDRRIIEAVEALPEAERTPRILSELGRAYNNLAETGGRSCLEKALSILSPLRDALKDDYRWNFRMGYALYHLGEEGTAFSYFRKADQLRPGDEDTAYFIRECTGRLVQPRFDQSFRRRTASVWETFCGKETEIRALLAVGNKEEAAALCETILSGAIQGISCTVDREDDRYQLTLLPRGSRALLWQIVYVLRHAPASLASRWHWRAGQPPRKEACVQAGPVMLTAEQVEVWYRPLECIILSVKELYMDAQEDMHMNDYNKITALYSRLSVGDEDRDGGESNSIQNQKIFLENYAKGQHLTNIRHYIDDDESGRFFDRSAYSRMIEDVESGKIGVCIMKDLTRWGRDYLQVGNAMEIFRRNNVRFIAVNNGIDSEKPDTLEFAPFINIMSEWYAKDISKKVKTGIKTKGMSGKPIVTEAPYGYVKDPDNKDFWIIDEEAAEVVRLIFRLFIGGKNRNQIAVYLKNEQIPTPTFYMKDRGRGTCKNKALNEDNRYKWNKATLTHILTRQEYCGDVVNFKTTKHFRDKRNHYVDRSQWQITENVHEPIIDRADFETAQRILENAPVRRPNGDGEIHPLSGLLFCKDCGAKMHIRIDYRNGGKRHVAYCSEYHKGKAKNPKCHSPHIIDADLLMQTVAEVLKKIEDYSISNRAEFEALVKKNLAMQQTDQTKKQQKRIPQITTRLEQIDKVLNKLYEDNALGTIPQDRYEQMSQKYSEEYYALKAELAELQEQLSAFENAGGRAQKFLKLTERYAAFTDLTPAILNEFISRIEVHERDKKRAKQAIQHIGIYFNYIGKFENEVTQLTEPTEQEIRQMREEIEEAKKEKSRAYHRQYSREYRARNLEKQREYDRIKAREYRARRKAQAAAAQPTQ